MSEDDKKPPAAREPSELELASTQDLLGELTSRFDNSVFMGHHRKNGSSSRCLVKVTGDTITCRGMIDVLYRRVEELDENLLQIEDDDEDDS